MEDPIREISVQACISLLETQMAANCTLSDMVEVSTYHF